MSKVVKELVKVDDVRVESLIKKNFSREFMKKIYDIYSDDCMSIVKKTLLFDEIFGQEFGHRKDYRRIGEGTNRFVCLLDNHIIKVAYNYLAYIDNMNELAMAKKNGKRLARAYETNGIILVSEYGTVMDKEDFLESQSTIGMVLTTMSGLEKDKPNKRGNKYILGDMGMSDKNYGNWGRRTNGDIIVLDYGYLYEVPGEDWLDIARCPICGSTINYTNDFSELCCSKSECIGHTKAGAVKYTVLRNNFGYGKIIDNIKMNLNKGKYTKFNNKGFIDVEVMKEVEKEVVDENKFELPEEIKEQFELSKIKMYDICDEIKYYGELNYDRRIELINELKESRESYVKGLYPMLLGVVSLNSKSLSLYIKDFEIKYDEIYKDLYDEMEDKELEEKADLDNLSDEDCVDTVDEYEDSCVNSSVSFVDKVTDEVTSKDIEGVLSTLEEVFQAETGQGFFMADENIELMNKFEEEVDDGYSFEDIYKEIYGAMEKESVDLDEIRHEIEEEEEEENIRSNDEIKEDLKAAHDKLVKGLTELIQLLVGRDDDDYLEGDVERTYLNGDKIDVDYSPEVNARNILGGWEPDEFAFPLYRHLLEIFAYDSEEVLYEFEARYKVGETINPPSDLYDRIENRNLTIDQIISRFEEDEAPTRTMLINYIGRELDKYYMVLDEYFDSVRSEGVEIGIDDPNYYLENVKNNTDKLKELQEARENLEDELLDYGMRLKDELKENKIVYYYDVEYLYDSVQCRIKEVIESMNLLDKNGEVVDNFMDLILNEYYRIYGEVLNERSFEPIRYGGSYVLEVGSESYSRLRTPVLKAKLVPKDSNEDALKPKVFNRETITRIIIENKHEILLRDGEELDKLNKLLGSTQLRDLCFYKGREYRYNVKSTKDFLRYLLSEKEVDLYLEFNEYYSNPSIKDVDKTYAKAIVDIMLEDRKLHPETIKFLYSLATKGPNEALSERSLLINVVEMNGCMTRLDLLEKLK